jgi:hypothetical protein
VFRNVGTYNSGTGKCPKRKDTTKLNSLQNTAYGQTVNPSAFPYVSSSKPITCDSDPSGPHSSEYTSLYVTLWAGNSVGIATDYGLDGPGIESRWGRDFPPVQTGPGAHPASCTMGTWSFPGIKCGRGVTLTTHPLLVPRT